MPDGNDQYFLLQNIIGAWPVNFVTGEPCKAEDDFVSRMKTYATKALRESKRRSSWIKPDTDYEAAIQQWIETLCADEIFLACIMARMGMLARAGFSISLARTALKFTIPGIPDIYQGCEGADFSLVDPDNRRPVDFALRAKLLEGHKPHGFEARKQRLIVDLLADRKASPKLYTLGNYEPLAAPSGWVAFRRSHRHEALLVAARIDPFTSTLAPAWAQPDQYWRNLLHSSAFDGIGSCCVSGAAIILKSALHESADEPAKP
jgi:(1->4)-alpha-D-glucan 1-alpha-D-glucosylmutase